MSLKLDVARKAFIRIRDIRYIELINRYGTAPLSTAHSVIMHWLLTRRAALHHPCMIRIEVARRAADHDDAVFIADVQAYQGTVMPR